MNLGAKTRYWYPYNEPELDRYCYKREGYGSGCSSYCSTQPVILDGIEIVPPKLYPVTILPIDDTDVKIGEVVLFPKMQIESKPHTFYLPNDRRFEKLRVFWAGVFMEGWLRVE